MEALPVIEHLDILGDGIAGFRVMLKTPMASQFVLRRTEETFHRGVIVTISFATHAGHDSSSGDQGGDPRLPVRRAERWLAIYSGGQGGPPASRGRD